MRNLLGALQTQWRKSQLFWVGNGRGAHVLAVHLEEFIWSLRRGCRSAEVGLMTKEFDSSVLWEAEALVLGNFKLFHLFIFLNLRLLHVENVLVFFLQNDQLIYCLIDVFLVCFFVHWARLCQRWKASVKVFFFKSAEGVFSHSVCTKLKEIQYGKTNII